MFAVPAVIFLALATICSLIGRLMLISPAFGVSTGWGMTALFVPFGPAFFRMSHRELAHPTRYWRMAAGPLMLLFFLDGGSPNSISVKSLMNFGKPTAEVASAGDTDFHLPVPAKVVAAAAGKADSPADPATAGSPSTSATATAVPTATPSAAVAAAAAAMPPAPNILSPAERFEANRREMERLAEWFDNIKHERGYLTKGDSTAVLAFNDEVVKYQAALKAATNEQVELTKLTAKK